MHRLSVPLARVVSPPLGGCFGVGPWGVSWAESGSERPLERMGALGSLVRWQSATLRRARVVGFELCDPDQIRKGEG